ncbi:carboxymuconolactone decarboxylase family protein, partial [Dactylosporangium darangshiense]
GPSPEPQDPAHHRANSREMNSRLALRTTLQVQNLPHEILAQRGMSSDDINLSRAGNSVDPKRAAVARFAQRVVESRGQVSDADLEAVRGAGYTDPQILAIVTLAVQVLLTNFINNVNQTDIDIPAVNSAGTPG